MAYPLFHPGSTDPQPIFLSREAFAGAFSSESEYIERKTGVSAATIQETVVAFSNADGGVILIGVTDSGEVVGRDLTQGVVDDLHRILRESHEPGRYSIRSLAVEIGRAHV